MILHLHTNIFVMTKQTQDRTNNAKFYIMPRNRWGLKDSPHVAAGTVLLRDMPICIHPGALHQQRASFWMTHPVGG